MKTDILEIDAEKLKRMQFLHVHFILLDVRSPEEYSAGHIKGALNLPNIEFISKITQMIPSKETPIVIYDYDGKQATGLILEAERFGYLNIVCLEGGYQSFSGK